MKQIRPRRPNRIAFRAGITPKTPPPLMEIDRIALILWHSSQLTKPGRTYVLAALATADALLNGHRPKS